MKTLPAMFWGAWLCCSLVGAVQAAEVRPLEFVHALQEKGYHDIAVEYLNMLKQQPLAPEVAAVWDLEMSKSLRGAANRAFNPKDFEEQMAEAQKHLDKFLQENPNHPEAVNALASAGAFSIDRALQYLRAGQAATDAAEKARNLAEARKALDHARPRLKQAVETLQKRLAAVPVAEAKPKRSGRADREAKAALQERAAIEQNLLDARFQAAMADYYTAQTYDDPSQANERKALLASAAKQLDDIYQANRVTAAGQVNVVGLYAHMWHGKIADELGDTQLAQDIYEEVLANDPGPNPNTADRVLDPLFAQVQQFYLAIIARKDSERFLEEALTWLKDYSRKSRRYEGYQGIALEVAKARLEQAAKATGAAKTKLTSEAVALLNDMVNVPSPYQKEAWELRRKYAKVDSGNLKDAKTFEEAAAMGQAAASVGQWPEAVAAYTKALEMAAKAKTADQKRIAELRQALANAKVMAAGKLYEENKMQECLAEVEKIIQEDKTAPAAEAAASLGVEAALSMVVAAADAKQRQTAMDRLETFCKMAEQTWPGRPPADDARMAMAQIKLASGQVKEALEVFEKINPKSERYPLARYLAARTYWVLYSEAKRQGAAAEKLAADRAEAVKRAVDALDRFRKAADPNRPLSPQHVESQLLVALIHLEAKEFKEASELLRPLVDQIKAAKPQALDEATVRIFRAALQAALGLGDVARASEVGIVLTDLGADNQAGNAVLVEFARALDEQRKADEAEATRANASGDAKAAETANAKLKATQTMIGNVLKKLAARKEHSVFGLIALGDLCVNVGLTAEATQLFQRVLDIPDVDKRAATRARAQLIGLLRAAGKFQEAIDQARQLATDNPRSLEPQMELGRCLQARAEQDPATYEEAIAQWTRIRNFLQSMRKKPPEYYEVIYNAAWCLYAQAYQTQEKIQERCTQAIQLLKSALVLNEKLSGPDMVEKYKVLMETIQKYQQESGGPASPAPVAERKK